MPNDQSNDIAQLGQAKLVASRNNHSEVFGKCPERSMEQEWNGTMERKKPMRRAPLKRGSSQLKRSRMKQRARPTTVTDEIAALRDEYREINGPWGCEICPIIEDVVPRVAHFDDGLCLEHCFQRDGRKYDLWSNWTMMCQSCHEAKHEHATECRVAILWAKLVKSLKWKSPRDFDIDELNEACPATTIVGWLDMKMMQADGDEWWLVYAVAVADMIDGS